jgi:endo-1,4-beta-xylanase
MKKIIIQSITNPLALSILIIAVISCKRPETGLKDHFKDAFLIGTAMNAPQILGVDTMAKPFIIRHFNSITAEDAMKWENIHPLPAKYDFALADSMVGFGQKHGMFIIGHTLVWHSQIPEWVFADSLGKSLSRDALLERMKDHIFTVVGHFKGKVNGWDVVNEAVDEDGQLRKTRWLEIIGKDYIQKAFEFAHEADPDAELYYNDYNIELKKKREGVVALIKDLRSAGVTINGVGIQGHWNLDSPDLQEIDESLSEYAALGLKLMITEMDVNVLPTPQGITVADVSQTAEYLKSINPYTKGLPDPVQTQLTTRYANFFRILMKHKEEITRVTFWGVHDGYSWKNNWPVKGRTNYPLLFDRNYKPKPAFYAVINEAGK